MSATLLGVMFLAALAGYWGVSLLIDKMKKEPPKAPVAAVQPQGEPAAPSPGPGSPAVAAESPGSARSVWDELHGSGPPK
jgi:hypothetical protein